MTNNNKGQEHDREIVQDEDKSVLKWLRDVVRLPQYYDKLLKNGFDDLEFIQNITKEDLKKIGIDKIGHQKRILKFIKNLE